MDSGDGLLITVGEYLNGDGFSYFDHAGVYVGMADVNGPYGYLMAAMPSGARLAPLQEDQLGDSISPGWLWSTGMVPLTDDQRGKIVATALLCKGVPYSWADYYSLAARRLHIPVPGLKDYIADSGHMICSQLCDYVYMQAGVHLFTDGRWPGYVVPADLANLLEGR
jgi:hypothetical protein